MTTPTDLPHPVTVVADAVVLHWIGGCRSEELREWLGTGACSDAAQTIAVVALKALVAEGYGLHHRPPG